MKSPGTILKETFGFPGSLNLEGLRCTILKESVGFQENISRVGRNFRNWSGKTNITPEAKPPYTLSG